MALDQLRGSLSAALLASQRSRSRRDKDQTGEEKDKAAATLPLDLQAAKVEGTARRASMMTVETGRSSRSSSLDLANSENVATIAVSMLDASSLALRKAVATSLRVVLAADGDHDEEATERPKLTSSELEALIELASSTNLDLQRVACDWIAHNAETLPRGKLPVKTILQRCTNILKFANTNNDFAAIEFALHIGKAIAHEGDTWATRMVVEDGWDALLSNILLKVVQPNLAILALQVSASLASVQTAQPFLPGCIRLISTFQAEKQLVHEACVVLSKNLPAIENEGTVLLFLQTASFYSGENEYGLVCDALRVARARSLKQAQILTRVFEEAEVMNTLNTLYRSQTFGSKLECALFLEALICQLDSDIDSKVRLCESGVLIRLIRLASFSAGTNEDGHDLAYQPAISALTELAKVDRIGARIVLAGGLGPLFSHANSSRPTRAQAKKALQGLGVTNLGSLVESWIKASKSSRNEEDEPLEHLYLSNGSKLLWPSPPPNFFTDIVNDPKAVLGRGAFSIVYRATLSNGKGVAVKRLTKAAAADPAFAEEIRVLARVPPHPNIVGLLGVYLNDVECLIISELGGPTLSSILASERGKFTWKDRLQVLIGIADGVRHLHGLDPCILHLDLKASNVLLVGEERNPKLCDFGLAVELKEGFEFLLPGEHGTIQYMAPECMRESEVELAKGFDASADVYSYSMIMWEVAHPGRIPYQGEHFDTSDSVDITMAIRQAVLNGRRPRIENAQSLPPGYENLMKRCWSKHPEDRPRFLADFFEEDNGFTKSSRSNQTIGSMLRKMVWEMRTSS